MDNQPPFPTDIQPPQQQPKSVKKYWFAATILIIIAALGTGVYFLFRNQPNQLSSNASVTLYYSDGKTVLWRNDDSSAPPKMTFYFVDMARNELRKKYGQYYGNQGEWKVTTTLDTELQAKAENLVQDNLANATSKSNGGVDEEALILQDVKTGQIKALVGGVDPTDKDHGQINFADTPLPPGGSIKPIAYAALMDSSDKYGAGTALDDMQAPIPGYPCTDKSSPKQSIGGNCLFDYDFKFPGQVPLRYALGGNRNVPAVKAVLGLIPDDTSPGATKSINKFTSTVNDMGATKGYRCYANEALTKTAQCYGASALGDGAYITLADELHVMATLANEGARLPQTTIYSATLNGKTKASWHQPTSHKIIKKDTAYIINDIMSDPNASYLPGSCDSSNCSSGSNDYKFHRYNGWKFAISPGITNDGYDANMASWSSRYAAISWVGNHTRRQTIRTSAEQFTKPLTQGIMQAAHENLQPENWTQPISVKTLPAFVLTNRLGYGEVVPSLATDIYPGWYK